MSKEPYIDRSDLLKSINKFTSRYADTLSNASSKIGILFEMGIYNEMIEFYRHQGYRAYVQQLQGGAFKYKESPTGLKENFSYFICKKRLECGQVEKIDIHHNSKVESSRLKGAYYTADVLVCKSDALKTVPGKHGGSRHSFCENDQMLTFLEVKHLNAFPEVIFNFSGLLLEFFPELIDQRIVGTQGDDKHLTPGICFSGSTTSHSEFISTKLQERYTCNIIYDLQRSKGKMRDYSSYYTYSGIRSNTYSWVDRLMAI